MKFPHRCVSLILALTLMLSVLVSQPNRVHAANKVYYPLDFSQNVLASRVSQVVSGGCAVASMATIEAYMFGATSEAEKKTIYNELVAANGDDDYAYWGNVGYKTSQDSIDWEKVYDQLAQGYPCIIHRPATGSQSQHWSVVAGYQGSSSVLEPDNFLVVEVNEKSGAAIQTVKEWRGSTSVDRYSWRADGLPITSLPGIYFAFNHPPVIKETGVAHVVSGRITSDVNLTALEIRVVSLETGKTVFSRDLTPNTTSYALSALDSSMSYSSWAAGTYYFTVYAKNAAEIEEMYGFYFEISASYPSEIPNPRYTLSFDAGIGTGSMDCLNLHFGDTLSLPACTMGSDSGTFQGWHLTRNDGKWFTADKQWLTAAEISAGGCDMYLFSDAFSGAFDAWWIRDTLIFPEYTFVAQWPGSEQIPPESTVPPAASEVIRISGNTRYETSFAVADELMHNLGVDYFDTILVASGTGFTDALSGSYLAAVKNAPILLTNGNNASALTQYITEHLSSSGTVYILGGNAAVPDTLENALKETGRTIKRLSGDNRIQTNLAILAEAGINGKEILVTTGWDYADSVAAAATGLPILIINPYTNELTDEQLIFLQGVNAAELTIIGGTSVVSSNVEAELAEYVNVSRIYGSTREETSALIAARYFTQPDRVCIAYSRDFSDALCGGPLAYALGAPMLLVNSGKESHAGDYIASHSITSGYILGGTSAVSEKSVEIIFGT